jgi:hypothetical protein
LRSEANTPAQAGLARTLFSGRARLLVLQLLSGNFVGIVLLPARTQLTVLHQPIVFHLLCVLFNYREPTALPTRPGVLEQLAGIEWRISLPSATGAAVATAQGSTSQLLHVIEVQCFSYFSLAQVKLPKLL